MSRYWFKIRKLLAQRVLHTDDTPHAIALGAGIAMLVAFLPLIGLQTVISVGLAAFFRANKAICIPIVWITNPFTMVPIYGACGALGRFVLVSPGGSNRPTELFELQRGHGVPFLELEFWRNLLYRLPELGREVWIGCVIVGCVLGIATYLLVRWGVVSYREQRRRRILRRNLLRSELQQGRVIRRTDPAE